VDRKRESIEKNAISFLFISKVYEVIKLLQEGIRPYLTHIPSKSTSRLYTPSLNKELHSVCTSHQRLT
jgi:hypothetical protein